MEGTEKGLNLEREGPRAMKRLAGVGVIFALAGALFLLSFEIPSMPGQLGPAFWPRMTLVLLMVSCGIKAFEVLKERGMEEKESVAEDGEIIAGRLIAMILLTFATVYLMEVLGFFLAVVFFMFAFLGIAGMRFGLSMCSVSVLGTVALTYLFVKVVYLPLPKGYWAFEGVTLFIYRLLMII